MANAIIGGLPNAAFCPVCDLPIFIRYGDDLTWYCEQGHYEWSMINRRLSVKVKVFNECFVWGWGEIHPQRAEYKAFLKGYHTLQNIRAGTFANTLTESWMEWINGSKEKIEETT